MKSIRPGFILFNSDGLIFIDIILGAPREVARNA